MDLLWFVSGIAATTGSCTVGGIVTNAGRVQRKNLLSHFSFTSTTVRTVDFVVIVIL